jgi:hypothetical protein
MISCFMLFFRNHRLFSTYWIEHNIESKTAVSFLIYNAEIMLQWSRFMCIKSDSRKIIEAKDHPCNALLDHIHTEKCNRQKQVVHIRI